MTIKDVYKKKRDECEAIVAETNTQIDIVNEHLKVLIERRDKAREKAKEYNRLYMECCEVKE
jgi:uncharacterized coiled-coil DUF342 family protein